MKVFIRDIVKSTYLRKEEMSNALAANAKMEHLLEAEPASKVT